MNIAYIDNLDKILHLHSIDKNNICLIGSASLAINCIRQNNDIDFCICENIRKNIFPDITKTTKIYDNIELILSKKYYYYFGISDDEIISNNKYHDLINGYKVIKLELEFAAKLHMQREKDKKDIELIINHAINSDKWDWSLVLDSVSHNQNKLIQRINQNILLLKQILRIGKNPITLSKKIVRRGLYYFNLPAKKYKKKKRWKKEKLEYSTEIINDSLINYSAIKLLAKQYTQFGEFNRFDTIVRYMAIEEYFNKNKIGFALYNKMQNKRGAQPGYEERFRTLIKSVNHNGFFDKYSIPIDSHGNLIDGAHRLALAIYFDENLVQVKIDRSKFFTPYGMDWFRNNGFDNKECKLIMERKNNLFLKKGLYFPVTLWPPVQEHYDEIMSEISKSHQIITIRDLKFTKNKFIPFCRELYSIDDIAKWKIERKIAFMQQDNNNNIRIFWIEIGDPKYRKKDSNGNDISQVMEDLKIKYREKYKVKVKNYVYDIILHAGDNYDHNIKMNLIYEKY
jgi:hypothetical protein